VVRRCQGLGLLDGDDTIEDVLMDNDFVEIGNDSMHECNTFRDNGDVLHLAVLKFVRILRIILFM